MGEASLALHSQICDKRWESMACASVGGCRSAEGSVLFQKLQKCSQLECGEAEPTCQLAGAGKCVLRVQVSVGHGKSFLLTCGTVCSEIVHTPCKITEIYTGFLILSQLHSGGFVLSHQQEQFVTHSNG